MTTAPGATAATPAQPHLTIRPPTGWAPLDLRELWEFRDLLTTLAGRDIKVRYKQTVLGAAWVVIQPIMGAGIFTFVFGFLAGMAGSSFPFTLASMLAWTAFAKSLNQSSACLVGNQAMVSKVYFPRLVLPLATVLSTLVDFVIGLGVLAVLMALLGIAPSLAILTLPVWLALLLMLALGVGLWAGSLMVSYRDVKYVLPVMVQFLMYASPVGYSLAALSDKLPQLDAPWARVVETAYLLNPLASLLEGFRWAALGTGELRPGWIAYSATVSVIAFLIGAFSFKKMERKFADVI